MDSSLGRVELNEPPFISVLLPVYNHAQFLAEAFDSLLAQKYPNWEAVVVNDGSMDDTPLVMAEYAGRDRRFRLVHKKNGGVSSALNAALAEARGEWVCWLSSDDRYSPSALETHCVQISDRPRAKFFHTHFHNLVNGIERDVEPNRGQEMPRTGFETIKLLHGNYVHGNTVAVHRSVFEKVGGFDERLTNAQDYQMWLRISALYPFHYTHLVTAITRIHPGQGSQQFNEANYYDSARAAIEFLNTHPFPEIFPWLDLNNPDDIAAAVTRTLEVIIDPRAFVYEGVGYITALFDRLLEWLSASAPVEVRKDLLRQLAGIAANAAAAPLPDTLKQAFKILRTVPISKFVYSPYDPLREMEKNARKMDAGGIDTIAATIRKYLATRPDRPLGT